MQVPVCLTNAGKILLAHLNLAEQQTLINHYLAEGLIQSQKSLQTELDAIKLHRFSDGVINLGSTVREISVPIYSYLNKCVGAISLFQQLNHSISNEPEQAMLTLLTETAQKISLAMGYHEVQ